MSYLTPRMEDCQVALRRLDLEVAYERREPSPVARARSLRLTLPRLTAWGPSRHRSWLVSALPWQSPLSPARTLRRQGQTLFALVLAAAAFIGCAECTFVARRCRDTQPARRMASRRRRCGACRRTERREDNIRSLGDVGATLLQPGNHCPLRRSSCRARPVRGFGRWREAGARGISAVAAAAAVSEVAARLVYGLS